MFGVFFLPFLLSSTLEASPAPKPNIVLVASDSFDGRLTFRPGNQVVDLPFVRFMNQYGATFLNAYTNSPICCPSRAAMWSGRFVHLTESWNNFKCLNNGFPTWMDALQKHGYSTQKYGKEDYTSGHHSLSNRVEAWTRDVKFLLKQEGRPVAKLTGNETTVRVMKEDWENTDKAVEWIRKTATKLTQPFALYLGLNLPHPYPSPQMGEHFGGSTFLTSPYWLKKVSYQSVKIPVWSPLSDMHPVDYYSSYTKNCTSNFTEKEIKDIRAHYYAMCGETDAMLGEILLALIDTGFLSSTAVMFTSDHGELAMEHRQFYKMSMYEGSSHVPFLIMGPNIEPETQISNVMSLVDVYPTMLDIAGIAIPQNISGFSILPMLYKGPNASFERLHPAWVLSEYHGCNVNASAYMLRVDRWKYIAYADGYSVSPQLFDLSADPEELKNLATKLPAILGFLDKKLRSILNYPEVSKLVHRYNKQQFTSWKQSIGKNYTDVIANLRWHRDWQEQPQKYETAIESWLNGGY
ncbi:arylsulfatase K isoform X2 [Latimeria chalumnae]|uniref:Arylsulfatase K n=1 Tax=Latimeria chalumnae TaxID=7897 RepID=H3AI19_LATCH|nr:PREDICTED: arylsulfatase K isoform X2 [Latimeria chalumnae]|eukprot:XP_005990056.1 PREDICTED: arylsulfatase K isoform X2 [Latimeria chalumnae]